MSYNLNSREKEIENRLRKDYFHGFDAEAVLGDVDFAVGIPQDDLHLFEQEFLLWAEAKKSNKEDIKESIVQLIITIGKARTFDRHLPPAFLGAFDAEKIAFVPYYCVMDVFSLSYINWNVRPSDHETETFQALYGLVGENLDKEMFLFRFDDDDRLLRTFIKRNFVSGKSKISKVRINKTNFTAIYQKWLKEVKPTINVRWDLAKKHGILEADFYLADIMSKNNCYLPLKDRLRVLLHNDLYELDREIDEMGLFNSKKAEFTDKQTAHTHFWNRYERPPLKEYREYIVYRRDLLVPQDIRETKGSFFTPSLWVSLSQEYMEKEFGDNWQEEYYIWDCAAGTGNLLANLTNKYNLWASTLDKADVDVMRDRIKSMNLSAEEGKQGSNLLDRHVFQFDFLNDPFSKLPPGLQDIINDPEKRKKLIIYINPPYAEAGNRQQTTGTGKNKAKVASETMVYNKYQHLMGAAGRELYAQFLFRIYREIKDCYIANFSTLKILQAFNFRKFRNLFKPELKRLFLVPANTFDNVKGEFPIGFYIWNTSSVSTFNGISADVYDGKGELCGKKMVYSYDNERLVIDWLRGYFDKEHRVLAYLRMKNTDIQNKSQTFFTSMPSDSDFIKRTYTYITATNIVEMAVNCAIRYAVDATWLNDRDQFLSPDDAWKDDQEFRGNCLVYILFNSQNRISCKEGINHFIPFTEDEVDAKDKFSSHFIRDFIDGRVKREYLVKPPTEMKAASDQDLFNQPEEEAVPEEIHFEPMVFSQMAQDVLSAGRELWRYYHQQKNALTDASLYDIRLYFQGTHPDKNGKEVMNTDSTDSQYTNLHQNLQKKIRILARSIEEKTYYYGFLKRNYEPLITPQRRWRTPREFMPDAEEEAEVEMPKPDKDIKLTDGTQLPETLKSFQPVGGPKVINVTIENHYHGPIDTLNINNGK